MKINQIENEFDGLFQYQLLLFAEIKCFLTPWPWIRCASYFCHGCFCVARFAVPNVTVLRPRCRSVFCILNWFPHLYISNREIIWYEISKEVWGSKSASYLTLLRSVRFDFSFSCFRKDAMRGWTVGEVSRAQRKRRKRKVRAKWRCLDLLRWNQKKEIKTRDNLGPGKG